MKSPRKRTLAEQQAIIKRLETAYHTLEKQRVVLAALRESMDSQRGSLPWFEDADDLVVAVGYQVFLNCKYIAELSDVGLPASDVEGSDDSPF